MAGIFMDKDLFLYFYALVPPEEIQSSVTMIKQDFKDRFKAGHALKSPPHITLIPPFKFEKSNEGLLINSVNIFSKNESRFLQKLNGFGSFPPRVIFIKVNKNESLKRLYYRFLKYMDEILQINSLVRGSKKFSPHMTVAFRDLTRENYYMAQPEYEKKNISFEFEIDGICLLRHNRKHWEIIHKSQFDH